jgi:predicted negative regulator of RcsB-dependent stress response
MSEEHTQKIQQFVTDNIVVFICMTVLGALGWMNHAELSEISLKQDKAILQTQADVADRYVTKQWFTSEDASLRSADTVNAAAISAVASAVADIKTSVAVIQSEIHNQTKTP